MTTQGAGINPFEIASNWLANQYERGMRQYHAEYQQQLLADTLAMHAAHAASLEDSRPKPITPESTGAPIPKKFQRTIPTPESTGAPMPGTLKTKTAIHPITGERVPRTPVKRSGYKQTAPGTKPKKK